VTEPGRIRVGTSGFAYQAWKGGFYPSRISGGAMLAFYAERFGAVEINATFRRRPSTAALDRWREAVPEGFRFSLKAHAGLTYRLVPEEASPMFDEFVTTVAVLGERLGVILCQAPVKAIFDADRLERFLAVLPDGPAYAFDAPFTGAEVDGLLAAHDVARCLNDVNADASDYVVTGRVAYFRFRRESYSEAELRARAEVLRELAARGCDVYAFFRHEDRPDGADAALAFQDLVGAV
jgi:uncharacterized protein YecE (DUF72 family)